MANLKLLESQNLSIRGFWGPHFHIYPYNSFKIRHRLRPFTRSPAKLSFFYRRGQASWSLSNTREFLIPIVAQINFLFRLSNLYNFIHRKLKPFTIAILEIYKQRTLFRKKRPH